MQKTAIVLSLSFLLMGAKNGCSNEPDPVPDPTPDAGGIPALILFIDFVAATPPFSEGDVVTMRAHATGGLPPYRYNYDAPAITLHPIDGIGEVVAPSETITVRAEATDDRGERVSALIEIEVLPTGGALLAISVEGLGRVKVGADDCRSYCEFESMLGQTVSLVAEPDDEFVFDHWSGCVSSTEPSIDVTVDREFFECHAFFDLELTPCEQALPPNAQIVGRVAGGGPELPIDENGRYEVDPLARIYIDGTGSTAPAGGGLTYRWGVSWDSLNETPTANQPGFYITAPGFSNETVTATLEVEDRCARTATTSIEYVTR